MKKYILAPLTILGLILISNNHLTGKSGSHPELPVVFAMDSSGNILDSTFVDVYGNYSFGKLKPGTYHLLFKKPGHMDISIAGVDHLNSELRYHVSLDFTPLYTETSEDIETDAAEIIHLESESDDVRSRKIEFSGARRGSDIPVAACAITVKSSKGISVRGSRSDGTGTYVDGARIIGGSSGSLSVESEAVLDGRSSEVESKSSDAPEIAVKGESADRSTGEKPGQITAGYWNDLDNWEKWKETNKDAGIFRYKNEWNFYPDNRFSVKFLDAKGNPVIGEKVKLKDQHGTLHWEAVTDNLGQAELWSIMNSPISTKDIKDYKVSMQSGERIYEFRIKPFAGSSEIVNLPVEFKTIPVAEIAFVVDATGSMGDEIRYLQSELLDVITRVKSGNKCLDVRIGSVFYRDQGDSYVTVKSDFSSNPADVVNFIFNQSAGGGGDFPEAVDAAMETTMDQLNWSEKAISKIMFLVLDAPPHSDSASIEKMNRYTKMAASKGIKIVPVTASGINQSTEFLMKYLAIATNGTYVYITDHSGIGNSHEKPTGVKENVQYLNDLMVDIINKNIVWEGCRDTTDLPKPGQGTVEIMTNGQWQVQFYPNPAKDQIMIKSNLVPDAVEMFDISGKLVKKADQVSEKVHLQVSDLITGVYFVKCRKGEQQVTCRMLVMH